VSIVDEHTRECLGGLVERSITGDDLIDELDRLAAARGYPAVLRCDNGPELACAAMADWAGERVGLSFIPLGEASSCSRLRAMRTARPCPPLGGARAEALAPSSLRHAQAFIAPQALDLLVVHGPAFAAGVVIRGTEPAPRMILRVLAQPRS
jgi:hypothetical protein